MYIRREFLTESHISIKLSHYQKKNSIKFKIIEEEQLIKMLIYFRKLVRSYIF